MNDKKDEPGWAETIVGVALLLATTGALGGIFYGLIQIIWGAIAGQSDRMIHGACIIGLVFLAMGVIFHAVDKAFQPSNTGKGLDRIFRDK